MNIDDQINAFYIKNGLIEECAHIETERERKIRKAKEFSLSTIPEGLPKNMKATIVEYIQSGAHAASKPIDFMNISDKALGRIASFGPARIRRYRQFVPRSALDELIASLPDPLCKLNKRAREAVIRLLESGWTVAGILSMSDREWLTEPNISKATLVHIRTVIASAAPKEGDWTWLIEN